MIGEENYGLEAILFVLTIAWFIFVTISSFVSVTRKDVSQLAKKNKKIIEENRSLIENNQKLISMINNMICNSDIKINWDKYVEHAHKLGIEIDDSFRNQDLIDPEG